MSDIVAEARKVVALRGDTYSSYEVVGLIGRLADEVERLETALQKAAKNLGTRTQHFGKGKDG